MIFRCILATTIGALLLQALPGMAECLPTPCYVERLTVTSCRHVSQLEAEGNDRAGLNQEDVEKILDVAVAVVIEGTIHVSSPIRKCGEAEPGRIPEDGLREYLALNASCGEFVVGESYEGFVRTPCCDIIPSRSPQCVLVSLEIFGPIPDWVEVEQR